MLPKQKTHPSARACVPCREKHLKCGGQLPVCNRCATAGLTCTWVQSRRGRRGPPPTAKPNAMAAETHLAPPHESHMLFFPDAAGVEPSDGLGFDMQRDLPSVQPSPHTHQTPQDPIQHQTVQQQNDEISEDTVSVPYIESDIPDNQYLISLYYQFIHPAHPFLLPFKRYRQNRNVFPSHLKQAMYYIASFHASASAEKHEAICERVFSSGVPNDVFKVQALILVTLASYARFQRDRGNKALNAAINLAYQIGLNSEDFSREHGALFRESWRRTWWELYSIAGLISLISGVNVRLTQPIAMTLPCECEAYEACQTPYAGSVRDMKERSRTESSTMWSSFAYRIEAMRILSLVLDLSASTSSQDKMAAEAAVSGWLLSLPQDKKDGLKPNGEVDEVMSCALMIIHLAGICLHLPQSPLVFAGDFKTVCGNDFIPCTTDAPKLHQSAALRSANAIARLLTAHADLRGLSPCFSCAVAYSSVVLLAEYSTQSSPRPLYLGENLQLELNALQSLGSIWPIAGVVRGQIACFARDVMARPSSQGNASSELMDLGTSLIDDQWLQDLVSEDPEMSL
ncbi:hypothetical protein NLU13_0339 [Sarocladium strictum]|uniref:Zn(2)-C6 fungal-type domain-containing protein n=1 Tax=Sarocladium strictum TaxID=5046 RepID=A0AA39GPM1_SARSR|nr:hypothetical protein NLU13_0339 [Sarocladium strictum]